MKHGNIIHSWKKKQLFFCYVLVSAFERNRCHHRTSWHGLHTYNLLPTPLWQGWLRINVS